MPGLRPEPDFPEGPPTRLARRPALEALLGYPGGTTIAAGRATTSSPESRTRPRKRGRCVARTLSPRNVAEEEPPPWAVPPSEPDPGPTGKRGWGEYGSCDGWGVGGSPGCTPSPVRVTGHEAASMSLDPLIDPNEEKRGRVSELLPVLAAEGAVLEALWTEALEELSDPGLVMGGVRAELVVTTGTGGTTETVGVTADTTGVTADTTGATADTTGATADTTGATARRGSPPRPPGSPPRRPARKGHRRHHRGHRRHHRGHRRHHRGHRRHHRGHRRDDRGHRRHDRGHRRDDRGHRRHHRGHRRRRPGYHRDGVTADTTGPPPTQLETTGATSETTGATQTGMTPGARRWVSALLPAVGCVVDAGVVLEDGADAVAAVALGGIRRRVGQQGGRSAG